MLFPCPVPPGPTPSRWTDHHRSNEIVERQSFRTKVCAVSAFGEGAALGDEQSPTLERHDPRTMLCLLGVRAAQDVVVIGPMCLFLWLLQQPHLAILCCPRLFIHHLDPVDCLAIYTALCLIHLPSKALWFLTVTVVPANQCLTQAQLPGKKTNKQFLWRSLYISCTG